MLLVKLLLIIYNFIMNKLVSSVISYIKTYIIYINIISEYRYRPIFPKKRCPILPAAMTFF